MTWPDDYINKIICGDCLDVMKGMPDGCVDSIVTDPPYFTPATHYQSRIKYARSWGDMSILETWWSVISRELARICPNGHVFVFVNGEAYPAFYKAMFPFWDKLKDLIWDKGHIGLGRIFRNQHEIIIWARSQGHYVPTDGKVRSDIIKCKATKPANREHPVEKPSEMLVEFVELSPIKGIVFDPFLGSGSTLVTAKQLGRQFIGIEIDPDYCEIARKRVAQAQEQPDLFRKKEEVEQVELVIGK